jgi:hypothetical protein
MAARARNDQCQDGFSRVAVRKAASREPSEWTTLKVNYSATWVHKRLRHRISFI